MAARLRPRHQDEIRAKIQGTQLIKFLQEYALGEKKGKVEKARITAALGLLKKVAPDLCSTELAGDPDSPLVQRIEMVIVDAP
jgi:hypothetical protein